MPRIALATYTRGMEFVARTGSDHEVRMDNSVEGGGRDAAARPKELPFVGLAGCTGMDVVSILHKMHQEFATLQIEVEGLEMREEHPKSWTRIQVTFIVTGDVDAGKLERAIDLSRTRYCTVSASLRPAVDIQYRYILNGSEKILGDPAPDTAG